MTPPSLGILAPKRMLRATLATALCGSIVFNSLAAFAQPRNTSDLPPPSPAAAPSATATVPSEPTAIAETPPATPPPPIEAAPPVEAAPPPPPPPSPEPVVVAPPAIPPMPMEPPPEAPPPAKPKLPAYVMWGVGGASLIAGAVFGGIAVAKESSFKDNPSYDKADTVHSYAVASDIGLGLGAILLVSGTVFYFIDDHDDASTQHAQRKHNPIAQLAVSPVVGMKTQGAAVTLKF